MSKIIGLATPLLLIYCSTLLKGFLGSIDLSRHPHVHDKFPKLASLCLKCFCASYEEMTKTGTTDVDKNTEQLGSLLCGFPKNQECWHVCQ